MICLDALTLAGLDGEVNKEKTLFVGVTTCNFVEKHRGYSFIKVYPFDSR